MLEMAQTILFSEHECIFPFRSLWFRGTLWGRSLDAPSNLILYMNESMHVQDFILPA